jgi:hypothetical protein
VLLPRADQFFADSADGAACMLAGWRGKDLIYAGKVDHGFDSASAKDLQVQLKPSHPENSTLRKEDRASRYMG